MSSIIQHGIHQNKFQICITAQSIIFGVDDSLCKLNLEGFNYEYEIKKIDINELIGKKYILNMDKKLHHRYLNSEVTEGSRKFIVITTTHSKTFVEHSYDPVTVTKYCEEISTNIDLEIQQIMKTLKLYNCNFLGIKDTFFKARLIPHFNNKFLEFGNIAFKEFCEQFHFNTYDYLSGEIFNLLNDFVDVNHITFDIDNFSYLVNLPYSFVAQKKRESFSTEELADMQNFLKKYYYKIPMYHLDNALDNFDSSLTYDIDKNLLKLVTTLEILFKINKAGNVKRQLSKKISYMTYDTDEKRIECNDFLNKCYESRNEYIHEGASTDLNKEDMALLRLHVKNTLLKFVDFIDDNKDNEEIFPTDVEDLGSFQYYKINVNTYFYKIIKKLEPEFWGDK